MQAKSSEYQRLMDSSLSVDSDGHFANYQGKNAKLSLQLKAIVYLHCFRTKELYTSYIKFCKQDCCLYSV